MTQALDFIFDVGKTALKACAFDGRGQLVLQASRANRSLMEGLYPCYDVPMIWHWLLEMLKAASAKGQVRRICVASHGAAAALIDPENASLPGGLVLPVMDYQWEGPKACDAQYSNIRPAFVQTFSPALPAGLNLGRQLYWQAQKYPDAFTSAQYILPYAQYWSWRLCGVAASEVSALGAHTDLWEPHKGDWSSLARRMGWDSTFAPIHDAWEVLGPVCREVASVTGLPAGCQVLTGVHDSNADYARFLKMPPAERPTLISTGTWAITMRPDSGLHCLNEHRDMLANVDITGAPHASARFMGGHEYAQICAQTQSWPDEHSTLEDVAAIIRAGVFALPDFSQGSGPFGGRAPQILGKTDNGQALASLYLGLMMDVELELLEVRGPVVIEGRFAENELLCRVLASLRPAQSISRLGDAGGVARGTMAILHWQDETAPQPAWQPCPPLPLAGLDRYRQKWRDLCEQKGVRKHA